jgi:hypothetical protein
LTSTNNICLFFLPFSGGKFIANCLALSRHVLCNNLKLALKDLEFTDYNSAYYQFKLNSVLFSLPSNFINDGKWNEFPGLDIPMHNKQVIDNLIQQVKTQNKKICHIAHWNAEVNHYRTKYPDLQVCKLINFKKFNSLCFVLKAEPRDIARHEQGFDPWIEQAQESNITFDVDLSMYNHTHFLEEIQKLYNYFGFEDFNPSLLTKFYNQYKKLHKLD